MSSFWNIIVPLDDTNLITNPSFEVNTTGYTTGGTNTIARDTTEQRRGVYGLKCTYSNNAVLASYAITLTAVAHTFAVDIYIPSNWDSDAQITAQFVGFTSATGTLSANADMTITDAWQRVWLVATPDAGDLSGALEIQASGTPTATEFIYTDGWHCSIAGVNVTYIDGDQPGCYWIGSRHGSTSRRRALSPFGGKIKSLADDFSFHVDSDDGSGMPPVNNLSSPMALQPGSLHDGQTIDERFFTLSGTLQASSALDFHAKKQALLKALTSTNVKIGDRSLPRTLWVTSPTVDKYILAVYDSGLESGLPQGFTKTQIDLKFKADTPLFYDIGESAIVLDEYKSFASGGFVMKKDGVWSRGGITVFDTGYIFNILAHSNGKIYLCGNFVDLDNVTTYDYLVEYDPETETISNVGSSGDINAAVYDLAELANGDIVAVGEFTNAASVADADYIAVWDGSSWSALGVPNTGAASITRVTAVTVGQDQKIWVGGEFLNLADVANADRVAYYDLSTSAWSAPTSDITSGTIDDIAIDKIGNVYIGGSFTATGSNIQYWDGSNWQSLSGGNPNGAVNAIAIDEANNIYLAGGFSQIGSVSYSNIAKWNRKGYSALGNGLNNTIENLAFHNGLLYIVGRFDSEPSGITEIEGAAVWDGSKYSRVGMITGDAGSNKLGIALREDDIYVGTIRLASPQVRVAGSTEVSYSATAPGYPIIEIARSGGTRVQLEMIENFTTGAVITLDYDLQDGETVTFNFDPTEKSITSNLFGDIIGSAMIPGSDFGQFYLVPSNDSGSQTNLINVMTNQTGSPTVTATMKWRDTYISQD